jgi:hypothetical protein
VTPWAFFGAEFISADDPPAGMLPGHVAQLQRLEAAERREEDRRRAGAGARR